MCKKGYIWNSAKCPCENGKYLKSVADYSNIVYHEIIETAKVVSTKIISTKSIPTNFNEKNVTCKTKCFYILIAFLLITMMFLIAVSIYCCFIKYQAKQKQLLPY